jgi:catechol 2,3-dioxygenase-like lactoylglutathione lyase family enzyme
MITGLPRIAIAVRDMDRAISTFGDGLGMPVCEFGGLDESLGIRMALCTPPGGSHIELMAPAQPDRAHARSLQGFIDRRGEGLFALMLYAPDPDAEARELEGRGLPVMPLMPEAQGRDIHPEHTCGVLIRIYPSGMAAAIEEELERRLGPPADRVSEAGVSGIARALIAVDDLHRGLTVYRDRIGLAASVDAGRGHAVCSAPEGATIELIPGLPGQGLHALILEADDPDRALETLTARGIPPGRRHEAEPATWELDTADTFGARIWIRAR